MKFRGTLLLMLLGLLLSGFYFSYLRPRAESRKAAADFEKRFFRAEPGDITFIRIENKDGAVDITHGPEGWSIVRPQRYRPDDGVITKLLDAMAGGRLTRVVGNAEDLPQFGFDRPILSITLGVGNRRDELLIGQKNPTDTGYYAYSEKLRKIFIINSELPADLYLRLYDLREKKLYPFGADQVGRVIVSGDGAHLDLSCIRGSWELQAPVVGTASDEEVKKILESLVLQKAVNFFPWNEKLQKLPQRVRLQLFDRAGKPLADSDVAYWGTGEGEGIVVHEAGSSEAVRTRREFWELLHLDAALLLDRRMFPLPPEQIERISFAGKESILLERQGGHWKKNGVAVTTEKLQAVIDRISRWKCAKRLDKAVPSGKPVTVIEVSAGKRSATLSVTGTDLASQAGAHLYSLPGPAGGREVAFWAATASAIGSTVLVNSLELDELLEQVRNLK